MLTAVSPSLHPRTYVFTDNSGQLTGPHPQETNIAYPSVFSQTRRRKAQHSPEAP
jgi:hypothetical protein